MSEAKVLSLAELLKYKPSKEDRRKDYEYQLSLESLELALKIGNDWLRFLERFREYKGGEFEEWRKWMVSRAHYGINNDGTVYVTDKGVKIILAEIRRGLDAEECEGATN